MVESSEAGRPLPPGSTPTCARRLGDRVTGDRSPFFIDPQLGHLRSTPVKGKWAARPEPTARRWVKRAWDFADESDLTVARVSGIGLRHGGQQSLGVRVARTFEHGIVASELGETPEI